jgi:hypothetical protein
MAPDYQSRICTRLGEQDQENFCLPTVCFILVSTLKILNIK